MPRKLGFSMGIPVTSAFAVETGPYEVWGILRSLSWECRKLFTASAGHRIVLFCDGIEIFYTFMLYLPALLVSVIHNRNWYAPSTAQAVTMYFVDLPAQISDGTNRRGARSNRGEKTCVSGLPWP
jgi:hypothetical protein